MRIEKVVLDNIRSYVHESISFSSGTLLLAGDIGSGKSTILQSIEFALFGTTRTDLPAQSLLRNGCDDAKVSLTFSLKQNTYTITRSLKRTKASVAQKTVVFYDHESQSEIELSATESTAKIEELLGYPQGKQNSLLYRYTVYTTQEKMKEIILEQSDKRMETLRSIFGIDKYKTVVSNAQLVARSLRSDALVLAERTSDLAELEQRKSAYSQTINSNTELLTQATKSQTEITDSVQEQLQVVEELQEKIQSLNSSQKECELLLNKQRDLCAQNEKLKESQLHISKSIEVLSKQQRPQTQPVDELYEQKRDIESKLTAQAQLQKDITRLQEQVHSLTKSVDSAKEYKSQLETVRGEKEKLQSQIESITSKLTNLSYVDENSITELEQARRSLESKQAGIDAKVSQIDSDAVVLHKQSCPTCKQEIAPMHKEELITEIEKTKTEFVQAKVALGEKITFVGNKLAEMKALLLEKQSVQTKLFVFKEKEESYTKQLALFTQTETELDKSREQLMQLQAKLLDSQTQLQLSEQLAELDKRILALKKLQEQQKAYDESQKKLAVLTQQQIDQKTQLDTLEKELEQTQTKITQFKSITEELKQTQSAYSEQKEKLTQLQSKREKISTQIATYNSIIAQTQKELDNLQIKLSQKKDAKAELTQTVNNQTWLKKELIPFCDEVEKVVLSQAYMAANATFTRWFSLLIEDEAIQARLDQTFSPVIYQDGYEMPLEFLSGGEKTSVALAYRLALNHVVNDVVGELQTKGLLVLDEPTDGFSSQQLDKMRDVLESLNLEQIILVSHESKIESFVSNTLHIVKENGQSKVLKM
jgi:exonuclease SbcC